MTLGPMRVRASRQIAAEALGTAFLAAAVIGSGIMGERLAGGNPAIVLLANTLATGAALVALIVTFAPISGAHFNPVVTAQQTSIGGLRAPVAAGYVIAQVVGGIGGAVIANLMFDLDWISFSHTARAGSAHLFSEAVATFGLVGVIMSTSRHCPRFLPIAVACYIVAAYWFTASKSFANPAVTLARACSDTFAGIRPADVPGFVAAQAVGGFAAAVAFGWLLGAARSDRDG